MARVSAIVPIYNDSTFINLCLSSIIDAVEEVIFVDGGPLGPSTDNPESQIDKRFPQEKIKFVYGTFVDKEGKWDRKNQLRKGYEEAISEYLMPMSVDMILNNSEVLLGITERYDEVWCNAYDFWMDMKSLRIENGTPIKNICLCCRKGLINEDKNFGTNNNKVFLHNSSRYHFGWIRPFAQQVVKHIRHINEGAWGDLGREVSSLGDEAIEIWAIQHVLRYKNSDSIVTPELISKVAIPEMKYLDGFADYQKDFEERTGKDFYVGITQIPTHLIV